MKTDKIKQAFNKFKPTEKKTTPPKHEMPRHGQPHGQPLERHPFDRSDRNGPKEPNQW